MFILKRWNRDRFTWEPSLIKIGSVFNEYFYSLSTKDSIQMLTDQIFIDLLKDLDIINNTVPGFSKLVNYDKLLDIYKLKSKYLVLR